jgi:hypothetical protein
MTAPAWKQRLDEARAKMVFEPTPSGAKPYVTTTERLSEILDMVEVTGSIAQADTPTDTLARGMALILREMINARLYERNMAARLEVGPDRLDEIGRQLSAVTIGLDLIMKKLTPADGK